MSALLKSFSSRVLSSLGIQILTFRTRFDFPYERYLSFFNASFKKDLIRVGGSGDGSYLVTHSLQNCNVLLSPGIGESISFDLEIAERGLKVFMTDGTIDKFPKIPVNLGDMIFFESLNVGRYESEGTIEINRWFEQCTSSNDRVLLQMDIEGYEFTTLEHLNQANLDKIKLLVIEIHGFHLTSKANYIGSLHRNFINWLESEFCLITSNANWNSGKTKVGKAWLPHAVETTWIRI